MKIRPRPAPVPVAPPLERTTPASPFAPPAPDISISPVEIGTGPVLTDRIQIPLDGWPSMGESDSSPADPFQNSPRLTGDAGDDPALTQGPDIARGGLWVGPHTRIFRLLRFAFPGIVR